MRHNLVPTARQIAIEVRNSEDNYDVALAGNARLLAALLDARREAGLPARTGREALDRAMKAISHGAQAREMLLDMHAELAQLNLRELAVGDVFECPEEGMMTGLRIVESESQAA